MSLVLSPPRTPNHPRPPLPTFRSSSSVDIGEILAEFDEFSDLLSESLVLDESSSEEDDDELEEVPPFPDGHRPPIFVIQSHRARVPFPIRPGVLAHGDLCSDEQTTRAMLTAPTIPRMSLVMKEHLFVQSWVDKLTLSDPPRHVPWASDQVMPERPWVPDGHIHAENAVKAHRLRHRYGLHRNQHWDETEHERVPPSASSVPQALSFGTTPIMHRTVEPKRAQVPPRKTVKRKGSETALVANGTPPPHHAPDPGITSSSVDEHNQEDLSGRTARQAMPPSTPTKPPQLIPCDLPLAVRRGKAVSGLQLRPPPTGDIEYPDIPTAFRGSPTPYLPKFDPRSTPTQPSMDHESMVSSLRLKCAAFSSGFTPSIEANDAWHSLELELGLTIPHSPFESSDGDWVLNEDLADFDDDPIEMVNATMDSVRPLSFGVLDESYASPSSVDFKPVSSSTPVNTPPHAETTPTRPRSQSSPGGSRPPNIPLPPRPALVNPSTPPLVRGILKKVKSVRFDDVFDDEVQDLLVVPPVPSDPVPSSLKRPSPLRQSYTPTSDVRPATPIPSDGMSRLPLATPSRIASMTSTSILKPSTKEKSKPMEQPMPLEKPAPRAKATPKEKTATKEKPASKRKMTTPKKSVLKPDRVSEIPVLRSVDLNLPQIVPQSEKAQAHATASLGRHSRLGSIDNDKENSSKTRPNRWSTMNETNLRSGLEMPSSQKSRISTPLRNIFRFR
ncbi:hypothetical protein BV22DRAFT_1193684 [Leucogyrophana mollusca]|uniref:Uncharacterized protein n=1 Tax=Leucogyrophana mollusca TaxID=85980 RepID=A0ACB8BPN3_9AGAM|nr:hypothetical protein BV22DRAFT_1193684 [Leucogyrophana mollusca]